LAWRDKAVFDAALAPSRLSADDIARERLVDLAAFEREPDFARFSSLVACLRVASEVVPGLGGGNSTPARRAFERPMAIACLADLAPCLPSRMCSISSWTNSPACVLGDFPSRLSCAARLSVCFSGTPFLLYIRVEPEGIIHLKVQGTELGNQIDLDACELYLRSAP